MVNKKDLIEVVVSAGSGIVVGYGVGVFVTTRKLRKEINAVLDEELARMNAELDDIRQRTEKTGPYASPSDAAEHLIAYAELDAEQTREVYEMTETIKQQYRTTTSDLPEGEEPLKIDTTNMKAHFADVTTTEDGQILSRPATPRRTFIQQNVFEEADENEVEEEPGDMDEPGDLNGERDPNKPYVISLEEFQTTEDNFHKAVVVYYEGDETLTDEVDTIIPDIEANVGTANMHRFGHGSGAKDTVYVRNEARSVDYEVVRIKRGYAEELFGISEDEDEKPRVRRMRDDG